MSAAWFKNIQLLKIKQWDLSPDELEALLSQHQLQPCLSSATQSVGWVKPKDAVDAALVHRSGQQLLVALGCESRLLPGSVVNRYTKERLAELAEQRGAKIGRREAREIKEAVEQELLPRAFVTYEQTLAWIDPVNGWLAINAASAGAADELVHHLITLLGQKVQIERLRVQHTPAAMMTRWLLDQDGEEVPDGITVDQDCELKSTDGNKSAIRYVHHSLDNEDIPRQIAAGKEAVKLALTWRDKVSFVLTDTLQLKRLTALGLTHEEGADAFDGSFALMSGELPLLFADLVAALGGLQE